MALMTVTLSPKDITYDPSPEVKHGDLVVFVMAGYAADATAVVSFHHDDCFTARSPFKLTSDNAVPVPLTVAPHAKRGRHPFQVRIHSRKVQDDSSIEGQSDRKNGGIDVTSDPPVEVRR
ncbi:hypothetical protein HJC10_10245 [Corallococcus exiguus]|uniref:hypothetical protein n=1 Tax=Corallococcus TaxID=83461 RepID=UPI0011C3D036|nr:MULTISPECIES: hypothetical protein [Corallococcus]NNB84232.1 hypothetical protein [Corallococcus exiguus]NNB93794.1 hypothetical protein [Corallococcus exiguus]NNC03226.1 hypothetical protein [Corallococcus exiguus]NPC46568.1 hypothetical protein [Corallococcus exiguus]